MKIFYIDLFSGAGGTTTGVHLANPNIEVVACVNHDAIAIESHKANHPHCIHFAEDVRDMKVIKHIGAFGRNIRKENPDCYINLWASLECTNYSKAKGGQPRDADSRTLAYSLYDYIEALAPDYVMIENVREFMSWGPLDEKGRPISQKNGIDYADWIKTMCAFGYNYDFKMLNSADFGAYTSRERYFGQFAKKGLPIKWPQATHSKKAFAGGLFETTLKPWKAVKHVLDLNDEGESIFNRKKPLVDATLERIYAGLVKFVASGNENFMIKYNSMNQSGHYKSPGVDEPCHTVTTQSRLGVVKASFLNSYYGNSKTAQSIENPSPTLTTKDRISLVSSHFMDKQYGTGRPSSVNKPNGTITTIPKQNIVTVQSWILKPQFKSAGGSIEKPCFTLIARMDKRPPYLIEAKKGLSNVMIEATDTPVMKRIKMFMQANGIFYIKMRMLKVSELLKIQGFPDNYILKGSQADQKKFIGNAVVPVVAKAIASANAKALINEYSEMFA